MKKNPKNKVTKSVILCMFHFTGYLTNSKEIIPKTTKDEYFWQKRFLVSAPIFIDCSYTSK
jgi:hypothetical protein